MAAEQIITRRNLPHWYVPGAVHFITYRLADTIPLDVLERWQEEYRALVSRDPGPAQSQAEYREDVHKRFFSRFDSFLDRRKDCDWLVRPAVAAMIRANLYHHDTRLYHLIAYCIMPNHVHVLLQPTGLFGPSATRADRPLGEQPDAASPLSRIMHSLKSYTAHRANDLLGRSGRFWQPESYDHWVRDDEELERIVRYIAANPVKAELVHRAWEWFFCSAHDRYLTDGSEEGWLCVPRDPVELAHDS
jgi:putative DNA methylase